MPARDHTSAMLQWWVRAGVDRADLAVRRRDGAMLWHADQAIDALTLTWARAHNARGADVYVRPARGYPWPLVFLDDVPLPIAAPVARKYGALLIRTSEAGGCHIWLQCDRPLHEDGRGQAQRHLARRLGADPGSVSGEHLGRLAGFKNWKRDGVWVNVLEASERRPWEPAASHLAEKNPDELTRPDPCSRELSSTSADGIDESPSGKDWGFVCSLLEDGRDPLDVHRLLLDRARARRGSDAARYAATTISRALRHLGCRSTAATRETTRS